MRLTLYPSLSSDRHTWNICSDDYSLWEELLNYTTNKALDHGVDSSVILDSLADFVSCFQTPGASPTSSIRLVDNLLSHLETSEMRDIPQNLLELVSDTMRATYPPEPRNKGIAMWLVRSLMGVVENCPVEFCLSMLQTVKESLCLWFADECGAWTEDHLTYDVGFFHFLLYCIDHDLPLLFRLSRCISMFLSVSVPYLRTWLLWKNYRTSSMLSSVKEYHLLQLKLSSNTGKCRTLVCKFQKKAGLQQFDTVCLPLVFCLKKQEFNSLKRNQYLNPRL